MITTTNWRRSCSSMCCPLRSLMRKGLGLLRVSPFDGKNVHFTYLGRSAIWQAVGMLGLSDGDEVLVPSYNCGSELDPLFHRGLRVIPYRILCSAEIDFDDLRRRATHRTRAVYVTHFFGFPQRLEPVLRFCRERQLFLIEDCAIALFSYDSGGFLGRTGDVAIFSLRKTLPLSDGGAIIVNNPCLRRADCQEQPPLGAMLASSASLVVRSALPWLPSACDGFQAAYRMGWNALSQLYRDRGQALLR